MIHQKHKFLQSNEFEEAAEISFKFNLGVDRSGWEVTSKCWSASESNDWCTPECAVGSHHYQISLCMLDFSCWVVWFVISWTGKYLEKIDDWVCDSCHGLWSVIVGQGKCNSALVPTALIGFLNCDLAIIAEKNTHRWFVAQRLHCQNLVIYLSSWNASLDLTLPQLKV